MIGTKTNANIAKSIYPKTRNLPLGWKFLGRGVSKYAYLGPDNVVYKVARSENANKTEHENAKRLRRYKTLPNNIKIPQTSMHGDVLAMQYIEKSKSRRYNYNHRNCQGLHCRLLRCGYKMETAFTYLGFYDFHAGNVMIDKNGDYWAVDLVY